MLAVPHTERAVERRWVEVNNKIRSGLKAVSTFLVREGWLDMTNGETARALLWVPFG